MMTSSNGNTVFRVTGHLCGEFTGPRWIPHTKASDSELWCLLWSKRLSKQSWGWWFETLSCSLWRHRNESPYSKFTRSHTHQNTARHTMPLFRDPTLNNGYWFIFSDLMMIIRYWHGCWYPPNFKWALLHMTLMLICFNQVQWFSILWLNFLTLVWKPECSMRTT